MSELSRMARGRACGTIDQGHVPEKLRQHIDGETLADKRIDIAPQKLHHQHEEADEERAGKQLAELAGDE